MQVLLLLPESSENAALLVQDVAGVPLLVRVIATAVCSGATSALILHGGATPWLRLLSHPALDGIAIRTLAVGCGFDPSKVEDWRQLEGVLEARVLWLPWSFVAHRPSLRGLIRTGADEAAGAPGGWGAAQGPAILSTRPDPAVLEFDGAGNARGWHVRARTDIANVEKELVRHSGKETDGIYSRFNRRLVRPLVRMFAKTPVTPNMVTFSGLPLALLSGYFYAQGFWASYVVASLFYFANVMVDEIDGMLARLTFRESAFGCWLETAVDYASYVPVFMGMTIGLSRQYGSHWLWTGSLVLFGTLTTFLVLIHQRQLATSPVNPSEYSARYNRLLEADSGNLVSRLVRTLHFFLKKGVLCHYVVIFSVLGGLPLFLLIAAFGSNVAWAVSLYNNRLFRRPSCESSRPDKLPATPGIV